MTDNTNDRIEKNKEIIAQISNKLFQLLEEQRDEHIVQYVDSVLMHVASIAYSCEGAEDDALEQIIGEVKKFYSHLVEKFGPPQCRQLPPNA